MRRGEVHLASFPFGGRIGAKVRPVLLLTGPVGPVPEVVVAYITSVMPAVAMASDITLDPKNPDHASTNLRTISVVRLHKLATIHQSDLVRYLGRISAITQTQIDTILRALLNL